jgi:hypothetical protein
VRFSETIIKSEINSGGFRRQYIALRVIGSVGLRTSSSVLKKEPDVSGTEFFFPSSDKRVVRHLPSQSKLLEYTY